MTHYTDYTTNALNGEETKQFTIEIVHVIKLMT